MKRFLSAILIIMTVSSLLSVFVSAVETTTVEENQLYGKSVLFVGDSICEASNEWNSPEYSQTVGWAGRIMSENKMTGLNKGKSGASVSNCRGINTILAQLANQKDVKYDYVILHGGVNDAWDSAEVGVITEGFDGPFDQSTFGGGLEATFKYAKENFKDAQFGYIINFSLPAATKYGRLSDMSEYFELAKRICDKWEIPYLDMYNDEELNNKKLYTHTSIYLPDFIHPNSSGYNIISPIINDWMKTLAVKEEESESLIPENNAKPDISEIPEDGGNTTVYYIIGISAAVVIVVCVIVAVCVLKKKKV